MLPDNFELPAPSKKEWPPIPEDVYQTEITNLEYKTEKNKYKEREKDPIKKAAMPDEKSVINFEFTIIEEGQYYGRKVWQKMSPIKPYPPSGTMTSWMYRLASAMAGHPITREEADKFTSSDVNDFVRRQVKVVIKHSVPDFNGKVWNNIESFVTAKTQLPPFDEAKVPKDNQPEVKNEPTGYEKAKAIADSLPRTSSPTEEELKVEDIPF